MIEKNKLVVGSKSNNSRQNLSKSKKITNLAKLRKSKNFGLSISKKTIFEILVNLGTREYPTTKVKVVFIHSRQAFTKAIILQYFNLEYYIKIKIDVSSYAISGILS